MNTTQFQHKDFQSISYKDFKKKILKIVEKEKSINLNHVYSVCFRKNKYDVKQLIKKLCVVNDCLYNEIQKIRNSYQKEKWKKIVLNLKKNIDKNLKLKSRNFFTIKHKDKTIYKWIYLQHVLSNARSAYRTFTNTGA